MLETLVESHQRTIRGNRTLIVLRLLFATISLAILLMQESNATRMPGVFRHVLTSGGEVTALAYSADGKLLLSGGSDATLREWDADSEADRLGALEGHGDIIRTIELSPDGKRIASAGDDKTARVFQVDGGKLLTTISMRDHGVRSVAWSADGQRLLTCGGESGLRVWDAGSGTSLREAGEEAKSLVFAAFLPGDASVVTVSQDGLVRFWNTGTLKPESEELASPVRMANAAAVSPDRHWLVVAGRSIGLMDLQKRAFVRFTEVPDGHANAIAFAQDNLHFITGGSDRKLTLWSVEKARELYVFGEHTDEVLAVALTPDAARAASGTGDKLIHVWDTRSGAELATLVGHKAALRGSYWQADVRARKAAPAVPLYWRPQGLVVIIVLLLTILYIIALRNPQTASKLAHLQILVDVGLISALVYHTGGVDSPFVTLYLVSIVAAAFVLSWRGALLVAACAATFFSLLTLLYGLGQIPDTYLIQMTDAQMRKFRTMALLDYVRLLLLPICAFFLVAVLAGNLSQRLAVARLLHHEVLEGIGEGILVASPDRKLLYHNQELRKLLMTDQDLAGKPVRELLGETVDDNAAKALAEVSGRRLEISHRRPDGMIIPFEVRLIPVLEQDGQIRGIIVVLDDITAEKKMEEFFKHKERIDAMGQISATIAHEIRNPLASIRGAVQEIARSVEIPESKKILIDIVLSESDRLDQIITDFLRYARTRPPKLAPVDIAQILADLRMMLIARPEAKDIEIRIEEPEEVKSFLADAEQLRQIFLNLGVNALQALDGCADKKVAIRLKPQYLHQVQHMDPKAVSGRVDRPGVCIEISDTGHGMPEDVRGQIFEPFFTTKPSGTGLGLAIVARIVQAHEGMIHVESRQGRGTTFSVWLPTDRAAENTADTEKAGAAHNRV
ncbi:MAG: PAS domain-containing protein [Planctomycetes bacterium]|nr:PAS domain-containing protein [Planctomycetota bacterium]